MSFVDNTSLTITVKDLIAYTVGLATLMGVYFTLKADIEDAKMLPIPTVSQEEFKYKDEMVRSAIMTMESDIAEIKETLKVLEQRIYDQTQ
jgi:hypothetical protein